MNIELVAIGTLVLDPANARKHGTKNLEAIKGSLAKFGQQTPIVVGPSNVVVKGNGTLTAARELGWKEIKVVRTSLSGLELTAYGIADNRTSELAEWDGENLSALLRSLEAEEFDLDAIGFDDEDLKKLLAELDSGGGEGTGGEGGEGEGLYNMKIQAPVYEPTGERPAVSDLYDTAKTVGLIQQIEETGESVPEGVKNFLRMAAYRHTVFNYQQIAEFYAHADAPLQELMEASALVIIDFQKAIENGFVRMSKELAATYGGEI